MATKKAPGLTDEERAELAALEKEEADRLEAEAAAEARQHLEALRLSKKLASKHGRPGHDFVVLETKLGNIAIRRPVDVEVDTIGESDDDRAALEKFAQAIVLEPNADGLAALMAQHPGVLGAVVGAALGLCKVAREDDAKK